MCERQLGHREAYWSHLAPDRPRVIMAPIEDAARAAEAARPTEPSMAPPEVCPSQYADGVHLWEFEPASFMVQYRVPWMIQATLAKEGYRSTADLADRWETLEEVRSKAPTEYGFAAETNGHTAQHSKLAAIRLSHAVEDAKKNRENRRKHILAPDEASAALVMTGGQRESMERAYTQKTGQSPSLKHQGSDHYMGLQYKECNRGQIGYFTLKQSIGKIPDDESVYFDRQEKRKANGALEVNEIEQRDLPQTWESWKRQTLIFRTSLLMCIAANPQHGNIQVDKKVLDELYDFIEGPEIATRPNTRPTLAVMRQAERAAWKKICLHIHDNMTLTNAIGKVRTDSLFWAREVYEHIAKPEQKGDQRGWKGDSKGKGKKGKSPSTPKGKGGKAKGGKGKKGQQKGQQGGKGKRQQPGAWASAAQDGQRYCWKYAKGNCTGNCNMLHKCPVIKPDGYVCGARHSVANCPNA